MNKNFVLAEQTNFNSVSSTVESTRMEDLDFVIDTKASDDTELVKSFSSPFPIFSNSRLALKEEEDDEESEKSESEGEDEDSDEYFGKNSDK